MFTELELDKQKKMYEREGENKRKKNHYNQFRQFNPMNLF